MPRLVSIHAESTGVTGVFEVRSVLEGSGAGRGPMSAATAGSVCRNENDWPQRTGGVQEQDRRMRLQEVS